MTLKVRKRLQAGTPRALALPACLCAKPPYPLATFVHGDLVAVVLRHWDPGCPMPAEPVDPKIYDGRAS